MLARLPLPGAAPDLLLVLVVALRARRGSRCPGLLTGFVAGLLADLGADHELGRLALAYAVVGYLAGLAARRHRPRSLAAALRRRGGAAAAWP